MHSSSFLATIKLKNAPTYKKFIGFLFTDCYCLNKLFYLAGIHIAIACGAELVREVGHRREAMLHVEAGQLILLLLGLLRVDVRRADAQLLQRPLLVRMVGGHHRCGRLQTRALGRTKRARALYGRPHAVPAVNCVASSPGDV